MRLLVQLFLVLMSGHMLARPQVLVVTATAGYRHESIPIAEQTLQLLAAAQNVELSFLRTADEMQTRLTPAGLTGIRAVYFVNTSGELPASAADTIVAWVRDGGTFVGIHSASDTWHSIPQYLAMLGGEFAGHPPETTATVIVDDTTHPATRELPSPHDLYEEFYSLSGVDLSSVRMLLSLHAGSQPLAWEKTFGRGRVLYTALGHRDDVWLSEWFRVHLSGIVRWSVLPSNVKRRAVRH